MGDWNFVLKRSTAFETVLRHRLGARGNGLNSLVSSVAEWLPAALRNDLHTIGKYRNRLAHSQKLLDANEVAHFERVAERARTLLNELLADPPDEPACGVEDDDEWECESRCKVSIKLQDVDTSWYPETFSRDDFEDAEWVSKYEASEELHEPDTSWYPATFPRDDFEDAEWEPKRDEPAEERDNGTERRSIFDVLRHLNPNGFLRDLFYCKEYQNTVGRNIVSGKQK